MSGATGDWSPGRKGAKAFAPAGFRPPVLPTGESSRPYKTLGLLNGFLSLAVALSILASMADDTQPISVDAEDSDHDHQPSSHGHRQFDDISTCT